MVDLGSMFSAMRGMRALKKEREGAPMEQFGQVLDIQKKVRDLQAPTEAQKIAEQRQVDVIKTTASNWIDLYNKEPSVAGKENIKESMRNWNNALPKGFQSLLLPILKHSPIDPNREKIEAYARLNPVPAHPKDAEGNLLEDTEANEWRMAEWKHDVTDHRMRFSMFKDKLSGMAERPYKPQKYIPTVTPGVFSYRNSLTGSIDFFDMKNVPADILKKAEELGGSPTQWLSQGWIGIENAKTATMGRDLVSYQRGWNMKDGGMGYFKTKIGKSASAEGGVGSGDKPVSAAARDMMLSVWEKDAEKHPYFVKQFKKLGKYEMDPKIVSEEQLRLYTNLIKKCQTMYGVTPIMNPSEDFFDVGQQGYHSEPSKIAFVKANQSLDFSIDKQPFTLFYDPDSGRYYGGNGIEAKHLKGWDPEQRIIDSPVPGFEKKPEAKPKRKLEPKQEEEKTLLERLSKRDLEGVLTKEDIISLGKRFKAWRPFTDTWVENWFAAGPKIRKAFAGYIAKREKEWEESQ